jgi:flavin reductase (DIM6/NTAB) family NADH-FMN oxidoreductase RutF
MTMERPVTGVVPDAAQERGAGAGLAEQAAREDFLAVMGSVCTPVAVVTAMAGARPHGTTVSAFASLSLDPPMVLVSLDRKSELLGHVRAARSFGVNVLAADQSGIAGAFAKKGESKFDGVRWLPDAGVPRLTGCAGWLRCTVEQLVDGGDHVVVLGHVAAAAQADARPLTYHKRSFGTHQPSVETYVRALPATGTAGSELADLPLGWYGFS